MSPFQQFRLWARRSPGGERAAAAVAAAAVLGALSWMVVPTQDHPGRVAATATAGAAGASAGPAQTGAGGASSQGVGSSGPAAGSGGAIGSGAPGDGGSGAAEASHSSPGPEGASPTGAGATSAVSSGLNGTVAAGRACVSPPGGAPGVTATQIKIAVTLTNIFGPAGNETFGGKPASYSQAAFQDVVDSINSTGGVACRKLVPLYYQVNPADPSDMEQKCLEIVQAGVFAEIDTGGESVLPGPNCFGQNHIPYFDTTNLLSAQQLNQYYPYLFAPLDTFDSLDRNTVFGLRDRGFFRVSNGFSKLGFVYLSCYPQVISGFLGWLHQAGLTSSQIVTYDLGCPSAGIADPSSMEQAILKFASAGVTNVTIADMAGSFSNFTTIAQQQGFHPKYGIPDETVIAISYGSQHPDYNNIAGAIAITASRYGEERTPGLAPSAATSRCNAIFEAHGQPALYQQGVIVGANDGAMCDQLWMFKAAVEHAPVLSREALAAGLQAARSIDFSYPFAPNDFSGSHVTHGGEYWRTTEFMPTCSCWQAIDGFHPSYP